MIEKLVLITVGLIVLVRLLGAVLRAPLLLLLAAAAVALSQTTILGRETPELAHSILTLLVMAFGVRVMLRGVGR